MAQAQSNSASIPEAYKLAQEHYDNKRLKKAALICKQILETKPDHARSLHLLGLIYYKRTRYNAANTCLQQALKVRPKWYSLHNDLGAVLAAQGRHQQALESYQQALALVENPDDSEKLLPLYRNMAVALQRVGNLKEAMVFHEKALAFNPNDVEALWNRAHIYLAKGDFERGWVDYEKRLHLASHEKPFRRHRLLQPRWDGRTFRHKTLLVQDEQGLGDVFQFVCLLPLVKSMGGIVILETRRKLTGILSDLKGADEVISREEARGQRQRFDIYTSLLSLPGLLNIRLDTIPAQIPYLYPDPVKVERWSRFLDCKTFRVGLVWTGNLDNISLRHRSLNFSQLAPYLEMPDVEYFSLQFGETAKQATETGLPFEVEDLSDYVGSFSELAAIAENMDLIVTVDTAMAHLVGALGRPVWMLLSYPPDWRWLLGRDDSPWYPTMRLFRQDQDVDWEPVLRRLHRELKEEVAAFNESMKPARRNVFRRIGSWFRK